MASARVVDTRPNSEVAGASAVAILAEVTSAEDMVAVVRISAAEDIRAGTAEVRSIARWVSRLTRGLILR